MHATLVLVDSWPITRACPRTHDLFDSHEQLSDVYVTDTNPARSLRDVLSDGAFLHTLRRSNVRIELYQLKSAFDDIDAIATGFSHMCDSFKTFENEGDLLNALKAERDGEQSLRLVIASAQASPASTVNVNTETKLAAASSVEQALAIQKALDRASRILAASAASSPNSTYFLSFSSMAFRNSTWKHDPTAVALWPKIDSPHSTAAAISSAPALAGRVLKTFRDIEIQPGVVEDLGAAITLSEAENGDWICTCRLIFEDVRHRITRTLPPDGLEHMLNAFTTIDNAENWILEFLGSSFVPEASDHTKSPLQISEFAEFTRI